MRTEKITYLLIWLLCSSFFCWAQKADEDCDLYLQLINKGNAAIKKDQLQKAIQYYNLAAINCPEKSIEAYGKAQAVFEKIEAINKAQKKILKAMYFFKDKYALAVNNENNKLHWGYINKKGVQQFGGFIYQNATIFRNTVRDGDTIGFADVKFEIPPNGELDLQLFEDSTYRTLDDRINLSNKNISILPNEVFPSLKNIDTIEMYSNVLAEIPPAFLSYDSLRLLNLGKNHIEYISPDIGKLTRLIRLELGQNKISEIPSTIGELNTLGYLDLGRNELQSIPDELRWLKNLNTLFLNKNNIKEIPTTLFTLPELTDLALQDNRLRNLPTDIDNAKKLERLDLANNKLESIPDNIRFLSKLDELNLSNNPNVKIPSNIFGEGFKIATLNISNCGLSKLPEGITSTTSLRDLNASDNPINTMPVFRFENLRRLDLSNCNIEYYKQREDSCYTKLSELNLSGNKIKILPKSLGNLKGLATIDLSRNMFTTIPNPLFELKNIKTINISNNDIANIPIRIPDLRNLEHLDLSNNKISKIPVNFSTLTSLLTLRLNNNTFEVLDSTLVKLYKLNELHLDSCGIKYLYKTPEPEIDSSNVGEIDVPKQAKIKRRTRPNKRSKRRNSNNNAVVLKREDIKPQPIRNNLFVLSLRNNKIDDIKPIVDHSRAMRELYLSDNKIKRIPNTIDRLTILDRLDVSNNQIESLPFNFYSLSRLSWLRLSNNPLQTISPDIFLMNWLDELYLDNCQLTSLPISNPQENGNLKVIDVSNNPIQNFNQNIFLLPHLEKLEARNCNIRSIASIPFGTYLQYVDLSDNKISDVPANILDLTFPDGFIYLPQARLNLKGNPLSKESKGILTEFANKYKHVEVLYD